MALIPCYQVILVYTFLVFGLFFGKGACQNLNCPNGVTNINAAMGQITYPGSSSNYGPNETKCWKIQVSERYKGIGIYYHELDIEQCDDCECDSLTFSYNDTSGGGRWRNDEQCGRQTPSYLKFKRFTDGDANLKFFSNELHLRFSSDDSVNHKGFNFTFIARTDKSGPESYLNASDDETIEFSTRKFAVQNYSADYSEQWYLIVPSGRQVQITFDTFELEQSENCKNAYVEIREAYFENGPFRDDIEPDYGVFLAEHLCGSEKPKPIQSTVGQSNEKPGQGNQTEVGKKLDKCCDCKCAGQGRASITYPTALLFITALLVIT